MKTKEIILRKIPERIKETDILILGAGLAGLGAAYTLQNTGLGFIILEAQELPGGRVRSEFMRNSRIITCKHNKENLVNVGAQWLHGRENVLYKIANQHNLLHSVISEEGLGVYIRNDGSQIEEFLIKKVDLIVGQILEECEGFAHNGYDKSYPPSVGEYLITEFDKRLKEFETQEDKLIAKQLLDWHIRFQIIDNSCLSVDKISAKSWGTYSFNGESCQAHINFKSTFYDIIEILVREIGQENLILNTEVENINWGIQFNSVTENPSNEPKVMVECKNGDIYVAKHIVCTFSIGVLKTVEHSMFNPPLPQRHKKAIHFTGFGTINKIFIQFEEAWWGTAKGFQLVFDDNDYEHAHWTRYISGFDVMDPGPSNTLLGWVGGMGAVMMENLSDETVINDCIQILSKFTKLPIPSAKHYYVTKWNSNKAIQGAYCFCSKNCDKENVTPKDLCVPILYKDLVPKKITNMNGNNENPYFKYFDGSPLIVFAGEACHEKYYSTAHGAFLSGCEQIKKILKRYETLLVVN